MEDNQSDELEARNYRLEQHLRKKPFLINLETTSVCNAKCCFCPYTQMLRDRRFMPMSLFKKIVGEYDEMGGGALLLTPIVGEFFVDRNCLERIEVARKYNNIGMISVTSNGIALNRIGHDGWEYFLRNADFLQISIGGISKEDYYEMYKVDRFDRVISNMVEFATLRNRIRPDFPIRTAVRSNKPSSRIMQDPNIIKLREVGWEIVPDNTFANWGGAIADGSLPNGAEMRPILSPDQMKNPCFVFYLGLYISSEGIATACGCMDSELTLKVGDCNSQSLEEIWNGVELKSMRMSFGTKNVPTICQNCSMYEDGVEYCRKEDVMNYIEGRFPFGY